MMPTTVMNVATLPNGLLNPLRHVSKPGLTKVFQSLADVRVAIRGGCGMLVGPVHVGSHLRARATIWGAVGITTLHIRLGIRSRNRWKWILGAVLIWPRLLSLQ
ncbi:hypothetical protein DES53_111174 [Roseimicrobium gellanilyticum]|uniref:Uncharacterized protein n=1 Tax=Roseimicrobium gellanilyticum TaxID=748857 RepID=A0A366H964_9BACT|nr:hypothetical protein DES53_111174 [Roseimicrobium gellanilyticum]